MLSYIYYFLGYEEDIEPDEKSLRCRNEVLKQVRLSKLKLKPVMKNQEAFQFVPTSYNAKINLDKKKDDLYNNMDMNRCQGTRKKPPTFFY